MTPQMGLTTIEARQFWLWLLLHSRKARNRLARSASEMGPPLGRGASARNVSNWTLDAASAPSCARSSHACASGDRFQPSSVAAKLTSRHLGWRGDVRNASKLLKKGSTKMAVFWD